MGTETKKATWFDTLDETTRENVFALMRDMRDESDKRLGLAQSLLPQFGEIIISHGAEVDERVVGEGMARYLGALDQGPEKAWEACVSIMELIIKKHNARWDYQTRRWEQTGQSTIETWHQRMVRIAGKA